MSLDDFVIPSQSYPRIEAGDTFQFKKNVGSIPTSLVSINIYNVNNTLVHTAVAVQSGTSSNFYAFYTTTTSNWTTVESSGLNRIVWIINLTNGSVNTESELFEIIKLTEDFQ